MRAIEHRIDVDSRLEIVRLVFHGDAHIGAGLTDEKLLRDVAASLGMENTYWLDLGDRCEFINPSDRRFDPAALASWIKVRDLADLAACQTTRYAEIFKPYIGTCLAGLSGNHELTLSRKYERDIYAEANAKLGLAPERCLGYSGFVRLRIYRKKTANPWSLTIYISHGFGGGWLAGAKALRLERLPMAFNADIYAQGHSHTKMAFCKRRVGIGSRSNTIREQPYALVNVGAYMRGELGGYAEEHQYYPQGLGPVEVWLYPQTQEMKIVQ
jgi:hypothetical protein